MRFLDRRDAGRELVDLLLPFAREHPIVAALQWGGVRCPHELLTVDGTDHLFTQPGTLDTVARLAADWFTEHLTARSALAATAG
jgi:hypothetical protein